MDSNSSYFTQAAALSDPDTYAHTDDLSGNWGTNLASNPQRVLLDLTGDDANSLLLKFYGNPASTAADDEPTTAYTGVCGIWGVSELVKSTTTEYVGDYLGQLNLVNGAKGVGTSQIIPDASPPPPPPPPPPQAFWARTIDPQVDRSLFPAMRIVGDEGEAGAVLVLDTMGYSRAIVEMRLVATGGSGTSWSPVAASYLGFIYRTL